MDTGNHRDSNRRQVTSTALKILGKSPTRTRAFVQPLTPDVTIYLSEKQPTGEVGSQGVPVKYPDQIEVTDRDEVWAVSSDACDVSVTEVTS